MSRVHVATEALERLGSALVKFEGRASQEVQAFETAVARVLVEVAAHVGECQRELSAARNALAHANKHTVAACRARVDAAEQRLMTANRAHEAVKSELDRVRVVRRRYDATLSDVVGRSTADLRKMGASVERYAARTSAGAVAGVASGGRPSPASGSAAGSDGVNNAAPRSAGSVPGRLARVLEEHGRELVDLADVSLGVFEHEPLGPGKVSDVDRRWAIETWESQVSGEIERGATFEDLAAMDAARGATGHRRLAGVWDTFLGYDPVVVELGPTGGTVVSGVHRVATARELGIRALPAEVRRSSR